MSKKEREKKKADKKLSALFGGKIEAKRA